MQHHPGFKKMEIIASERGHQLHYILADFDTCSNLKQSPTCPSNRSGIQKDVLEYIYRFLKHWDVHTQPMP